MKLLETKFKSNGFTHVQIARKGNLAIYKRFKKIRDVKICYFEVVIVRVSPEWTAFGQTFPEVEKYPTAKQWGVDGWTYNDLESAWDRLWQIRRRRKK